MDANGLRCFGLALNAGLQGWRLPAEGGPISTVEASHAHVLTSARLASHAVLPGLQEKPNSAAAIALAPAMARDRAGNFVVWDPTAETLYSVSSLAPTNSRLRPIAITLPDQVRPVRDLAISSDDLLWVAGGSGLWILDTRSRFPAQLLDLPDGFVAQKLAASPRGGVYVLDSAAGRLARSEGLPLSETGVDITREKNSRFEACELNPNPPRVRIFDLSFEAGERAVSIACSGRGLLAVLSVRAAGGAQVRVLTPDGTLSPALRISGPRFPHALGWLDEERVALMTDGTPLDAQGDPLPQRDPGVFVYAFPEALQSRLARGHLEQVAELTPSGDYYPLADVVPGPFVNSVPVPAGEGLPQLFYPRRSTLVIREPAPVARISLASRARYGVIANFSDDQVPNARVSPAAGLIDTKDPISTWHRLYVEGSVPSSAAMIVWLAATDAGPPAFVPANPARRAGWHPHLVGDPSVLPEEVRAALPEAAPRTAWVRDASEVPGGASVLTCERKAGISGLFTALIQRAGLTVRTLKGSRLWVAVELFGDGRGTPELVALRAYGSRVSYRDRYLPALYREQVFGAEADRPGGATGADFLERFIALFEGVFTSMEDRIAHAHLLTDAFGAPDGGLPWLASWIGLALEPGTPARRARWMIANGPRLARRHGTLQGLKLALDIATDGSVTRGRIVVAENFRLRRTLATILGADLSDAGDPLTAGISQSGNSFVGDSLFLGDESSKMFLALFRNLSEDPAASTFEAKRQRDERESAVHALYDGLAYRVTVLLHDQADADEQRLVRRLAAAAAPAHVEVSVVPARYPLLVGVASLVGADTFVQEPETPGPVTLDHSQLGYLDTLQGLGTLDAAAGAFGGLRVADKPVAAARADRVPGVGEGFILDGGDSTAAPGREIFSYRWRLLPQPPDDDS